MQVDLFKLDHLLTSESRLLSQMETRKYSLNADLNDAREYLDAYSESIISSAIKRYETLAHTDREYERIGNASSDNLWKLEALGVGKDAKTFTTIIDLSDALDYVMDFRYKCGITCVRDMKNYSGISKSFLNFDFRNCTDKFSTLFIDSKPMTEEYLNIMEEINRDPQFIDAGADSKMSAFVYRFYSSVLGTASSIRDLIALAIRAQHPGQVIYRSKSYAAAILSTEMDLTDELVLVHRDHEDYRIPIKSYRRFEWCREEVAYEISRCGLDRK